MDQPSPTAGSSQPLAGTRRRWSRFRQLPIIAQIAGWLLLGLLLLYLFPWEDLAQWFRGAQRWQQIAAVAVALAIFGGAAVTGELGPPSPPASQSTPTASESKETGTPTPSPSPARSGTPQAEQTTTSAPALFPERLGGHEEDIERRLGEPVNLKGWSVTVHDVANVDGSAVVSLTVANQSDDTRTASYRDWRLQTPTGSIIDPGRVRSPQPPNEFNTVDLVPEGSASGDIYFDTAVESGDYYVIFQPEEWDPARGIWGARLP